MTNNQLNHLRLLTPALVWLMGFSWLISSVPLGAQAITGQKTFSSPLEAVKALVEAARSGDPEKIVPILGPQAITLVSSGDPVADKQAFARFVKAYDEKHGLLVEAQGYEVLQVGPKSWPFPIPVVRDGVRWYFDSSRGAEEIINRRIGRNELGAIGVCEGFVQAESEYASKGHDGKPSGIYAQRLHSDPGKHNGLYWAASKGEPESPMGPLVTSAVADGYSPQAAGSLAAYHGYLYKILTAQGPDAAGRERSYLVGEKLTEGFALIAYPVQYGSSGIMTFLVNQSGIVYQKDLGEQTSDLASQITAYNPDSSWQPAKE